MNVPDPGNLERKQFSEASIASCLICGGPISEQQLHEVQYTLLRINGDRARRILAHPAYGEIFKGIVPATVCPACYIPITVVANASHVPSNIG